MTGRTGRTREGPLLVQMYRKVVFENYANFRDRATRAEYWWFVLANFIVGIALNVLARAASVFGIVLIVYSLALLVPGLAAATRRLHDTGRTGWWLLLGLIPCVGLIVLIVFLAEQGKPGPNQYGPDPRGGTQLAWSSAPPSNFVAPPPPPPPPSSTITPPPPPPPPPPG